MKKIYPKRKLNRVNAKQQIRHTHKTSAAFEDAISIMNDIILTLGDTLEYANRRAQNALEVLKVARKSPHAYNPDRPSGKRFVIRRR